MSRQRLTRWIKRLQAMELGRLMRTSIRTNPRASDGDRVSDIETEIAVLWTRVLELEHREEKRDDGGAIERDGSKYFRRKS